MLHFLKCLNEYHKLEQVLNFEHKYDGILHLPVFVSPGKHSQMCVIFSVTKLLCSESNFHKVLLPYQFLYVLLGFLTVKWTQRCFGALDVMCPMHLQGEPKGFWQEINLGAKKNTYIRPSWKLGDTLLYSVFLYTCKQTYIYIYIWEINKVHLYNCWLKIVSFGPLIYTV